MRDHKLKFHKQIENEFKLNLILQATKDHSKIAQRSTYSCGIREVVTKARLSVRVRRAETRLTVYRSPLVRMLPQLVGLFPVERACVKLDEFFCDLVIFRIQMCLEILKIQILMILRLRLQLVNDRNARTENKF